MNNFMSNYIKKNSKMKDVQLKYDFMPSLLEIIERPSHIAGKVIIVTIFMLFVFVIIWSSFSKIDVVVAGSGTLLPAENIITIKSPVSGNVKKINVSDGDLVEKGDILFEYDHKFEDISIHQLEEHLKLLEVQKKVYMMYNEDYNAKIDLKLYDKEKEKIVEAIVSENNLFQKNYNKQKEELIRLQYIAQVQQKIVSIEQEIINISKNVEEYKIRIEKHKVRAPRKGYIWGISVMSEEQYISPSETIASIVPYETQLEFKGVISDRNISYIQVGSLATIKLGAYNSSDYGNIKGIVTYVSPTTYSTEHYGNVYAVYVRIDEHPKDMKLISGLTGIVEIKVGKRTVLNYFLDPITSSINNSLKEK